MKHWPKREQRVREDISPSPILPEEVKDILGGPWTLRELSNGPIYAKGESLGGVPLQGINPGWNTPTYPPRNYAGIELPAPHPVLTPRFLQK